ncbi:NOF-FB transposable element protein, partial [Aphis craccivora]
MDFSYAPINALCIEWNGFISIFDYLNWCYRVLVENNDGKAVEKTKEIMLLIVYVNCLTQRVEDLYCCLHVVPTNKKLINKRTKATFLFERLLNKYR